MRKIYKILVLITQERLLYLVYTIIDFNFILGPYVTGILSNIIGRKPCILIGACLNIIAYILVVTTANIGMIYAVRIISGLGMGILVVGNIVYVGEIA